MSKLINSPAQSVVNHRTEAAGCLRGGRLHMPKLVAQSVGLVGVSGGLGVLIPAMFATAGRYACLAYLFAVVALLFASWSITFFAMQTASSGALYTFAAKGCGDKGGLIATPSGIGQTFATTLALAAVGWLLAGRDIRLTTRLTLCLELVTLALIVGVLASVAADDNPLGDRPQFVLDEVSLVQLQPSIVLAFFSFVGFGSATALCFFVAFLALVIAGSRIAFTLARDGYFLEAAGRAHARHATQAVALNWVFALKAACTAALLGAGSAAGDAYGWLSTVATYCYLIAYLLVALAALLQLQRLCGLRARHLVVSAAAVLLLIIPIVDSVYAAQEGAYTYWPYFFLGLSTAHVLLIAAARRSGPAWTLPGELNAQLPRRTPCLLNC